MERKRTKQNKRPQEMQVRRIGEYVYRDTKKQRERTENGQRMGKAWTKRRGERERETCTTDDHSNHTTGQRTSYGEDKQGTDGYKTGTVWCGAVRCGTGYGVRGTVHSCACWKNSESNTPHH